MHNSQSWREEMFRFKLMHNVVACKLFVQLRDNINLSLKALFLSFVQLWNLFKDQTYKTTPFQYEVLSNTVGGPMEFFTWCKWPTYEVVLSLLDIIWSDRSASPARLVARQVVSLSGR